MSLCKDDLEKFEIKKKKIILFDYDAVKRSVGDSLDGPGRGFICSTRENLERRQSPSCNLKRQRCLGQKMAVVIPAFFEHKRVCLVFFFACRLWLNRCLCVGLGELVANYIVCDGCKIADSIDTSLEMLNWRRLFLFLKFDVAEVLDLRWSVTI